MGKFTQLYTMVTTTSDTWIYFRISTDTTLLFLSLFLPYLCIANDIYNPSDVYTISCGSSNSFTVDTRNWTADINTNLLSDSRNSHSVAANALTPTTVQGPYASARVSYSQFTYSFPVTTSGPKFIRLFFYPTTYQNFDPTKAFFSVKSGDYTLLKDFNASLYADADDDPSDTFFREFSVNVQDGEQTVNITFIPSVSNKTSSSGPYYAFINGIEVVSMPPYLYHTNPSDRGLHFVGSTIPYIVDNSTALETKYRLNVGGRIISASGDTGMLRYWEPDDNYMVSENALAVDYYENTKLNFSIVPQYTAPDEVYRTLRHMGENATRNLRFNLTWELPVDSGFTYMMRLHFCELDPNLQKAGDRRFFIYIQDQMVESNADVLLWTGEHRATPIVKSYAMVVLQEDQKNTNISLKMSTLPQSLYADSVLNGIELFKINNSLGNLAGPNPDPRPKAPSPPPPVPTQNKSSNKNTAAAVAGAISGGIVLLLLIIVVLFLLKRRQKKRRDEKKNYYEKDSSHFSKYKSEGGVSSLPSDLCRHFSIEEIRTATNNFDEVFVIGTGGFGNVYKGYIDDGSTPVAIKRLKPGSQQGAREFMNEIEMLSQLRHLHLVSLIGYCYESNEMILVYDFMTRGTLRDHLYNTDNPSLSWKQRIEICIGAARGLHYLHTGAKQMIIHRDVKSTNILLDEKWIAKVSDFGLSRVGPTGTSMTHVSTVVKGSVGYLDPEYYKRQRLTEKSDVYSFGVVLLEVLCGRAPLLRNVEKRQVSLVDWARRCYHLGTVDEIVDPTMNGEIAPECLRKFSELAVKCLLDDGTQRPSMNDVVGVLEFVLQLQESSVGGGGEGGVVVVVNKEGRGNREDIDDLFSSGTSVWDNSKSSGVSMMTTSGEHSYGSSETQMPNNVFSEIGDPKGR